MELDVCGQIPCDWSVATIEDVCERVTSGGTPSRARPEYYCDGKWGWVKTQELLDGWIDQTEERITDEAIQHSSAKILPANTVLLALYGATVGQLGIVRRPMTCNQACCAIIVDPRKADFRYVYHQLRLARPQLRSLATGAAQQNLSGALMKSLRLPLPPLSEQKRIAHILGTLDDKIELNRRMNATLEGISRAIFKSWFVDFDPVRQKAAGKQPVGMDAQSAALFPDSFEDSEIGEVPKGWATCTLDDYTQVVIGGDWGTSEPSAISESRCLCIRGADIPSLQSGGVGKLPVRYLKSSSLEKRRLAPWDLVIEISGGSPTQSTGRPVLVTQGFVERLGLPVIASNFCRIVKLKDAEQAPFVYFWLRHLYDADVFLQYENGTTGIKNFAYTLFAARHPLLSPDSRILEAFYSAVSPVIGFQQQMAREADSLATLRDTLLPKLLSGEIRVPEAEQAVEEAIA